MVSVDGVMAREAMLFTKQLCRHLGERWEKPMSHIMNFVQTKLSISILKASHQCLRGARTRDDEWGRGIGMDGSSLGLFRSYEG